MMTSIVIDMENKNNSNGTNFQVNGNITRRHEKTMDLPKKEMEMFHLVNICSLVEERESVLRSQYLGGIFLGKTLQFTWTF